MFCYFCGLDSIHVLSVFKHDYGMIDLSREGVGMAHWIVENFTEVLQTGAGKQETTGWGAN